MTRHSSKFGQSRTESLSKSLRARRRAFEAQALGLPSVSKTITSFTRPIVTASAIVIVLFWLGSLLLAWAARSTPLIAVGRVMHLTKLVDVDGLVMIDPDRTRSQREQVARQVPWVYKANDSVIIALAESVRGLPEAVASAGSLLEVNEELRTRFGLNNERLRYLRTIASDESQLSAWNESADALGDILTRRPIIEPASYQRAAAEGTHRDVTLVVGEKRIVKVSRLDVVSITDARISAVHKVMANDAGFLGVARDIIMYRLAQLGGPTFELDEAATVADRTDAEKMVASVTVQHPRGEPIYRKGDVLRAPQKELALAEYEHALTMRHPWQRFAHWGALAGATGALTAGMVGYAVLFAPRMKRRTSRVVGAGVILLGALALACGVSILRPDLVPLASVLPTVLVTILFCIGYDRRAAMAFGLLHGLLVAVCLSLHVAEFAVIVAGVACVVSTLREVRDRKSLVRTGVVSGLGVALATVLFGLLTRPMSQLALRELLMDAAYVGAGTLILSGLTLFVLPLIERVFNVTTGMTLGELRDPRQPLLKELQLRAPGSYTHSLNVATIAEQAAEAIGADSLLTYVGSIYHDVGKMNKPDYFVENMTGGANKHDKLSPAMSLLIVVGHVKDGVELAREFHLPPKILHFIEAHHGTTLVEYFFHRARKQAMASDKDGDGEPDDASMPDETEYRYPGPKPRMKEVAIVMIADAVESASRAMADPTPARIETLVREIAHKRLVDGQFDDCELTLKELSRIVESVARTVISMHHTRIAYPGASPDFARGGGGRAGQGSRPSSMASTFSREPSPATGIFNVGESERDNPRDAEPGTGPIPRTGPRSDPAPPRPQLTQTNLIRLPEEMR